MNLSIVSTGEPTYWLTDSKKISDLLDFGITRGISKYSSSTESCLDLWSDYFSIIITLISKVITKGRCTLHNVKTDWYYFQELLTISLNNSIPLKAENNILHAVESFNHEIQQAAWNAILVYKNPNMNFEGLSTIKDKLAEKRKLRKLWHINRCPILKTKLNRVIKAQG